MVVTAPSLSLTLSTKLLAVVPVVKALLFADEDEKISSLVLNLSLWSSWQIACICISPLRILGILMSLLYPCKIVSHFQEKTLLCSKHEPNTRNHYAVNDFLNSSSRTYFLTTIIDMKEISKKETKKIGKQQKVQYLYILN